jgi:septin family protein
MKVGTIIENEKRKIKIFAPPKEHGPAHVHVIAKGENAEVKISLIDLDVVGKTNFNKQTVKGIIKYVHQNYDILMGAWEKLHENKKKAKS